MPNDKINCKVFSFVQKTSLVFLSLSSNAWAADESGALGGGVTITKKIIDLIVEGTVKYGFQALGGVIVLIAGWIVAKIIGNFVQDFLNKQKLDVTVAKFIVSTIKLIVMILALLVSLGKFGVEIAPFIAGLSVVGFGTSFALQGPLSNYAAGATLIFTKPFKVGDIIEVVGELGEVQDMTLPRTILKTIDGTIVVIPNKHIVGEIVHNFSDLKRIDVKVGVGYATNTDLAVDLIQRIIRNEPRIFKNAEVKVGIFEFGDSSVNLYARIWCKQADYWDVLFSVNKKILEEFKKNKISIPFPQREVRILDEKSGVS